MTPRTDIGRAAAFVPRRRVSIWQRLSMMMAVHRQRAKLADMADQQLRDIGLTRDQALRESRRPIWDAPGYWSR